jgi:hypothetical protein
MAVFIVGQIIVTLIYGLTCGWGTGWTLEFFLKHAGIGLLHVLFILSLCFFLGLVIKNMAISITIILGLMLLGTILGTVTLGNVMTNPEQSGNFLIWLLKCLPFFQSIVLSPSISAGGLGSALNIGQSDLALFAISNAVYIALIAVIGLVAFKKSNLN